MIPKKIHYIWLGKKAKNKLAEACLLSWKINHPDFEIIEWNEDNLNIDEIEKECYFFAECRKRQLWAYMADYLRIKILYEYGGIYIDTDVQSIKNISNLLNREILIGYEAYNEIGTGTIGAAKNNELIKKILDFYRNEIMDSKKYTIPHIFSEVIDRLTLEQKDKLEIFSMEVLSPYNYKNDFKSDIITEDTYTIHWFDGSWTENIMLGQFLQVKHIKNPIKKFLVKIKKRLGYYKRKILK